MIQCKAERINPGTTLLHIMKDQRALPSAKSTRLLDATVQAVTKLLMRDPSKPRTLFLSCLAARRIMEILATKHMFSRQRYYRESALIKAFVSMKDSPSYYSCEGRTSRQPEELRRASILSSQPYPPQKLLSRKARFRSRRKCHHRSFERLLVRIQALWGPVLSWLSRLHRKTTK